MIILQIKKEGLFCDEQKRGNTVPAEKDESSWGGLVRTKVAHQQNSHMILHGFAWKSRKAHQHT